MNRLIALSLTFLCCSSIALIVAFAPWAFETGGYLHHALVHGGAVLAGIGLDIAVPQLLKE